MNRAIKVADLEESWNQNDDAGNKNCISVYVSAHCWVTRVLRAAMERFKLHCDNEIQTLV